MSLCSGMLTAWIRMFFVGVHVPACPLCISEALQGSGAAGSTQSVQALRTFTLRLPASNWVVREALIRHAVAISRVLRKVNETRFVCIFRSGHQRTVCAACKRHARTPYAEIRSCRSAARAVTVGQLTHAVAR